MGLLRNYREKAGRDEAAPAGVGLQSCGSSMRIDRSLLAFLAVAVAVITAVHEAGDAHFDFGVFYYAARMVWDGKAADLYSLEAQRAAQLQYGRPADFLFYYPPFVLIPFLPLALLPMRLAFILWTALSVAILVAVVRSLSLRFELRYGNWPLLLCLAFMPVASNLGHGQFSLLVLGAYAWCYTLWRDGRRFSGGAALALAMFKFQLLAGFCGVLLLTRKWRELAGLGLACIPLGIASWLIVGGRGLLRYPAFLIECEHGAGVEPLRMANLRGLTTLLFGNGDHLWLVLPLSILAVVCAASSWQYLEKGFAAAVVSSVLVSYHGNPQDLSVLLIPFFLISAQCSKDQLRRIVYAAIALPALLSLISDRAFALLAIPLAAGLWWIRDCRKHGVARNPGSCY